MKAIEYIAPKSLTDAVQALAAKKERARMFAGGTDLLVQLREYRRDLDLLVDAKHVKELNQLSYDAGNGLVIGAAVPCHRIYEHNEIAKHYPGLTDAASLVGGIQIQSRASVGGNLCNASPAADTIPPLIAAGAACLIAGPKGVREIAVENFCTGPGRTVLGSDELLQAIRIPAPRPRTGTSYLRFIPRNEMDIAVVGVGVSVSLDESKNKVTAASIALAAVAPTPLLAPDAAAALIDGAITDSHIDRAAELARAAARPISDMRGSADYRRHLVGVLVKRALQIALDRAKEN